MNQSRYRIFNAVLILALVASALVSAGGSVAFAATIEQDIASVPHQADGDGEPAAPWSTKANPANAPLYDISVLQDVERVEAAGIDSDDFNSCQLDTTLWTFTDPKDAGASYEMDGTRLKIMVPSGVDYNLWENANFAPRVTQAMENADFQVEAKFESPVVEQFQMQGIIVDDGAGTFMRYGFYATKDRPGPDLPPVTTVWVFAAVVDTAADPNTAFMVVNKPITPQGNDLYMRVQREFLEDTGYRWVQEYSFNGLTWTPAGTDQGVDFIHPLIPATIGVYAGSADSADGSTAPGHTAIVDYFFTTDDPIDPEDPKGYDVTTSTVGQGSVGVSPAGPTYACGDSLTFTAVPELDWALDNWSGDVTGKANPTIADYVMGMNTTATFIESETMTYTLSLTTGSGNGVALPSPNLPFYVEGQEVTLTATPDEGFEFSEWSGDLTGSTNPATITMDGNKSIAANFDEIVPEGFTLDVQVFGNPENNQVTKNPDKSSYTPDEQVTLTAVPTDGWAFSGWSGDAAGTDPSVTITMDSDKVVLATFAEEAYTLTVNTTGDGAVAVEPQSSTYKFGDEITLTATPADGAEFSGWGGDLTGSDNPASYTITGDTAIKATFSSTGSSIYLPIVSK